MLKTLTLTMGSNRRSTSTNKKINKAFRELNIKLQKVVKEVAATHNVDGTIILGMWIATLIATVFKVPTDIPL